MKKWERCFLHQLPVWAQSKLTKNWSMDSEAVELLPGIYGYACLLPNCLGPRNRIKYRLLGVVRIIAYHVAETVKDLWHHLRQHSDVNLSYEDSNLPAGFHSAFNFLRQVDPWSFSKTSEAIKEEFADF